jgi:hypothetical protein
VKDRQRIAEAIRASGAPDFLNRWLDHPKEDDMAKIGPKEQRLLDLKAQRCADTTPRTTPAEPVKPKESVMEATTSAAEAPKQDKARKPPAAKPAKRAAAKAKPAKPTPKAKAAKPAEKTDGPRPGSKLAIIGGMLARPEGCTTKQVLAATEWPAVSMPQQAKALGIKLVKEKVDGAFVYRAA